jgi:hypothetical protein
MMKVKPAESSRGLFEIDIQMITISSKDDALLWRFKPRVCSRHRELVFLFLFLFLSFSPHRHHFAQHDSAIIRLMPGEKGNETLNRGKR